MANDTNPRARAIGALTDIFLEAARSATNFGALERDAIRLGHECMAEAIGIALEALDAELLADKPDSLKAHDIRERTLATEIGDVNFSIRRYRDAFGCDVYLLADALDIPYGARVSPGAIDFLVEAAAHVSYAKAASLLARSGSLVQSSTVMRCMRDAGLLCSEEDEANARSLYQDGVIPKAEGICEEICIEADGTYFSTQKCPEGTPKRMEVKGIVGYEGKEVLSGKVRRRGCVHHALVGKPEEVWSQAAAAIGEKYDLANIKQVHLGADGERWCRDGERYFPFAKTTFHLDPFHVNQAIMSCFKDSKMAWNVIDVLNDGDKQEAIALLKACEELGIANAKRTSKVIAYLEGNIDAIALEGPSLGTMESENQHLYGARMDCWPCAWSIRGASDMARIISRRASKRAIPKMTRERSVGETRRKRREKKELAFYEKQGLPAAGVLESVGKGYLPPHQVNTRRIDSGKAYVLYKGMANLDRGI